MFNKKESTLTQSSKVILSPTHRLQWEESQKRHVILYPEGMVKLNESSYAILKRCTGEHSVAEIIQTLERCYHSTEIAHDVEEFLQTAYESGWIET